MESLSSLESHPPSHGFHTDFTRISKVPIFLGDRTRFDRKLQLSLHVPNPPPYYYTVYPDLCPAIETNVRVQQQPRLCYISHTLTRTQNTATLCSLKAPEHTIRSHCRCQQTWLTAVHTKQPTVKAIWLSKRIILLHQSTWSDLPSRGFE